MIKKKLNLLVLFCQGCSGSYITVLRRFSPSFLHLVHFLSFLLLCIAGIYTSGSALHFILFIHYHEYDWQY